MLYLMRKFSFMFLFYMGMYLGLLFPMLNYDRIMGPDPLDLSFVLYLNSYMYLIIIGSIWAHEQLENKYSGRAFLRTLPIKKQEIVIAKFSLALLSVLVYVVAHLIWFFHNFEQADYLTAARANLIFNANVCLVISALTILGFCRYDYPRFGKIAIVICLLFIISPIPLKILIYPRLGITTTDIVHFVTSINPVLVTGVGLLIFFVLMQISIRSYSTELN